MATEITMPKLSDTMEEGTILKWRVKKGDRISKGDIIAEVETDKAAMEMEAFDDGTVSEIKVEEGETVPVGTVIAVLSAVEAAEAEAEEKETPEKSEQEKPKEKKAASEKEAKAPERVEEEAAQAEEVKREKEKESEREKKKEKERAVSEERPEKDLYAFPLGRGLTASPSARRLARERGIESSSGPGKRTGGEDRHRGCRAGRRRSGKRGRSSRWGRGAKEGAL